MSATRNDRATGSQTSPEVIGTEVDVVIIGMGPGGEDVAGQLAEAGLDVLGIEELAGTATVIPDWGHVM